MALELRLQADEKKGENKMKHLTIVVLIASAALLIMLNVPPLAMAQEALKATLIGFEEPPSISTTASGEFRGRISEDGTFIEYELSYSGLEDTITQSHIHLGQRAVNGAIIMFLCQTDENPDPTELAPKCLQEGTVTGVLTADNIVATPQAAAQGIEPGEFDEMLAAIRAGVAYANVHSRKFRGGEIRGQIEIEEVDESAPAGAGRKLKGARGSTRGLKRGR